jgi:hypothetical protein
MKVLSRVDLDPDEADDLARVVEEAKREGGFLHIEVRKVVEPDAEADR